MGCTVFIGRSISRMLASGPDRLVEVSVVVVVSVVVEQPTSANKPAQANNRIRFFIGTVLSESRLRSILFW
jgi:hypothetical protein